MNKIFYVEFDLNHSKNKFRLEIFNGEETALSDPEFVELPLECISLEGLEWSYDTLPVGINSDTVLDVEWYLVGLPDEFVNILFNPKVELELSSFQKYLTGNVYTLFFNGEVLYRGVQMSDMKHNLDIMSNTFKAKVESLGRYIFTCIDWPKYLKINDGIPGLKRKSYCIYEYYKNLPSDLDAIIHVPNKKYSAQSYYEFENYYTLNFWVLVLYSNVFWSITRGYVAVNPFISVELPWMKYYSRNLSGVAGAELTDMTQLFFLSKIVKDGKTIGGLFSQVTDGTARYGVLYDWLSDWAIDHFNKLFIPPNGEGIKRYGFTNTNTINLPFGSMTVQIENYTLKQLTVSLEEFDSEDIDRYTFKDSAARNGEDFPIPMIFNNSMNNDDYQQINTDKWFDIYEHSALLENGWVKFSAGPVRMWNVYYFDQPTGLGDARAFKVDEYCQTDTGNWNMFVEGERPSSPNALIYQREYSKPKMYEKLIDLIGKDKSVILRAKIDIESINLSDYWNGANNRFFVDLRQYSNYYSNYPQYYYLTKVRLDIINEKLECEFIGF